MRKQTQLQQELSIIRIEKEDYLQQIEGEKHRNEQLIKEPNQTVEILSSEEELLETESHIILKQSDFSENNNDIIDVEPEEIAVEVNTTEEEELVDENIEHDLHENTGNFTSGDISISPSDEANEEDEEDDIILVNIPYIHDNSLIPADKLSIPEVYDVEEEKTINSRDFFSQNENELILWRRNLQERFLLGQTRFICPECKQPVKISGHKLARGRVCYFAHYKDSDDCPYKTGVSRTKEEIERLKYSLVKESNRHKYLKAAIASALNGERSKLMGVENVECEKYISSDIPYLKWRRPDVYAEYNGRKFVFELQLSTTFVSVVVDRDIFYRLNDYNIIWVFNFEDNAEYVNLQNLMCKDIYYANKRNVFIFDADTEKLSKEKGELVLKCRWLDENGIWSNNQYITLDMLQYDEENHKPFIIDADKTYLEKYPEHVERRKKLEHSREYILKALMERQKNEEELEKKRMEERSNLQSELLKENKCVDCFRSGSKYGYQYEGTTILPAKYTSAENIRDDGYAQVGFNRKIGLVRKDGKEILPTEYKNIDVINSRHGVVMASYKRIDLCLADEIITLCDEYDDKEQEIVKKVEDKTISYVLKTKTYKYSYTSSYYGDHPICHKEFTGYSETVLFSLVEENEFCIIFIINGKTYSLSENTLCSINGSYSEIKRIGMDQMLIVKDSNTSLWGVIDFYGDVITNFEYSELIPTESEYLIVRSSQKPWLYGMVDYLGREFIMPQYKALIYLNSERLAFRKDNLWGICDRMGNILHEAEYTYVKVMSSGSIMASTLESYSTKWTVENNIPSYNNENPKLCLLDENGDITFSEQDMGQYIIRHSGDLFSILSHDYKEIVSYSLSSVERIDENTTIIKNLEESSGFFVDDKCVFFKMCKNIERLCDDTFKFKHINGYFAIGNHAGPICDYVYSDIKSIDSEHYIASKDKGGMYWWQNSYSCYVIIDKTGKVMSKEYSYIGEFKDGSANAVYIDRKGIIDVNGEMQEEVVDSYGDYLLCVKFENYYFRNKKTGSVSEEYKSVENLFELFFVVKKIGTEVKLYSLEENKETDRSFVNVTHLNGDLFVVHNKSYASNVYQLYRKMEPVSAECYSSVSLLDNGYISLRIVKANGYLTKTIWKILRNDGSVLNDMEYDSILEASEESIKVRIGEHEGFIDINGNAMVEKKTSENGFVLTHRFADRGLEDKDGNTIISLDEHFSCIEIMEGNLIKTCKNNKYALYSIDGTPITEHKFSSITCEAKNRYAVLEGDVNGHIDSQGNYIETSAEQIAEDGTTIYILKGKYGLKSSVGGIIIPAEYSSIDYLAKRLLAIKKDSRVALFNFEGEPLTEFKYSSISCNEDGSILAVRNKFIGGLDENGNEIIDFTPFNGGYLCSSFGEYSVVDETKKKVIIAKTNSMIKILDEDGVFSLHNNGKISLANKSNKVTNKTYNSVENIGNGFFVVSCTITKEIKERKTSYGYRRNPYTYYATREISMLRFGVVDKKLNTIISCKYKSISTFDSNNDLVAVDDKGTNKTFSLEFLNQISAGIIELAKDVEYQAQVVRLMSIGIVVKIDHRTYIVHKRYLYKQQSEFALEENLMVKYLNNDSKGFPIWETSCCTQESSDESIDNKN
ncbi:MAG: WG repeat-containing protein [Bacteroidales bacterium]|nr:WG repeat-containing protein [Bacteroidales bacterium]